MNARDFSVWLGPRPRDSRARSTLFCLPFSGGGASAYGEWRSLVPAEIEVVPIRLPGREARIGEPAGFSAASIARILAEHIDHPFAIYGHSMGARLGFEVLRCLRDLGGPDPVRFYPAACLPPDVPDPLSSWVELPDGPFIDTLVDVLGAPAELRDVPELREFQLPLLRHDLGWCHAYSYLPAEPLATVIVGFAGEADRTATPEAMAGWSRHGQRGTVLTVPGGHFFFREAARQLTSMLARELLSAISGAVPPVPYTGQNVS
jgi:surfactin synthase thioesterase subunit